MSELLKDSLLWRMIAAIAAWCGRTPVAKFFAVLKRCWCDSFLYQSVAHLLRKETATERSGLRKALDRLNGKLSGSGYGDYVRSSVTYRLYGALMRKVRESYLFGKILSGGFTTLLLVLFAAYWPVDYLLRDILQMGTIASLWDELLFLVSFVWLVHTRLNARDPIRSRLNSVDLLLGFYVAVGLVLLAFTRSNLSVNISGFRASIQYILAFFLVVRLIRDDRDFMLMYNVMILFATVFALHGIYQYIIGVPIPSHWTDQAETEVRTRVFSIFSNPNILGAYMVLFAPMAIGQAYASESAAKKVLYWFCGMCMCIACLFTMSRGAWLALAAAAVFFVLIVDRRLFLVMLVLGIAACFLPFVQSRISYLFTANFQESNNRGGRAKRWATALSYVEHDNAWAGGLGYGIYGGAVAVQNPINQSYDYMYVDNYYVKILAENGIIGLSSLLFSMLGLTWNGFKAITRASGKKKPLCVGLLAGLLGILVQSIFESIWEEPYMMALFFVVAAMLIFEGFFSEKAEQ